MIEFCHDGQKVMATKNLSWIAQFVREDRIGTIYWKWIWNTETYKHWSTHTKKKRMNITGWGFWAPVIIWEGKRNRPGYDCIIVNFEDLKSV